MVDPIVEFSRRVVAQVMRDDVIGLSAELAYRFFLALFPFAIFVAGVGAFVARHLETENPAVRISDQLAGALPEEAATVMRQEIQRVIEQQNPGLVSFGVVAAVFFATGGTNALMKAMNRAFGVDETRPLWRRYLLALGMTLLAGGALIGAFILFMTGQVLAGQVAARVGLGDATSTAVGLLRWPLTALLLVVAVTVLYRLGPNIRMSFRWIVPGAVLFTAGWLAATWAFGFYVGNFGDYGATYGTLAGVAILLVWFYLTAFVLLLGVEVNDVLAEMREPGELEERRRERTAAGEDRRSGDERRSGDDRRQLGRRQPSGA